MTPDDKINKTKKGNYWPIHWVLLTTINLIHKNLLLDITDLIEHLCRSKMLALRKINGSL